MCFSSTPSASNSILQAWARALVMGSLKRACTMPMRNFLPFKRLSLAASAPWFASSIWSLLCNIANNFQTVAGHAGHAARVAHELHFVHAAFTQNLGTNAVAAQVHAAAFRAMAGACRAVKLGQQLLGALAAIEQ